jgi:hypothetical protein
MRMSANTNPTPSSIFVVKGKTHTLEPRLIDVIAHHAPGFLTPEDLNQERRLVQPIAKDFADGKRVRHLEAQIEKMVDDETSLGINASTFARYSAKSRKIAESADYFLEAYTGWLVTNKQFRAERDELRDRLENHVRRWRRFPRTPRSYLGERASASPPRRHRDKPRRATLLDRIAAGPTDEEIANTEFHMFYRRWCLDSFITWDLPLPMLPSLFDAFSYDTFTTQGSGVHIFIPWYLLRNQTLTLRTLADAHKLSLPPTHLRDWLEIGASKYAPRRFRYIAILYRYWHLALVKRFPEKMKGHVEALERAFASYMGEYTYSTVNPETIKKLRLALAKSLKP